MPLTPTTPSSRPPTSHRAWIEQLDQRLLLSSAGTIFRTDFEEGQTWNAQAASTGGAAVSASHIAGAGTIDTAGTSNASVALGLNLNSAPSGLWTARLSSGPLAVANTETNLGKLTLSFDLWAASNQPVTVTLESLNSQNAVTGTLRTTINPAAPRTYQRFAIDLSAMTAPGGGAFNPAAPSVRLSFDVSAIAGWSGPPGRLLAVDNVNYSRPAYYVSPTGSDAADGRSEATALRTLQRASNVSQPGDIILIRGGDYTNSNSGGVVNIGKGGVPSAWVTFKNYPGETPRLVNNGWNAIRIGNGTSTSRSTGPAVAYVEIRGLTVRGNADDPAVASLALAADAANNLASIAGNNIPNGNAITVEGRYELNIPHHIRIAGNRVDLASGSGINILEGDRIQIENNIVRNTSYWTTYATSGISILSASNFDLDTGYTRLVLNNESSGNQTKIRWIQTQDYSDGNGIILDYNFASPDRPNGTVEGRTLVANNLTFNNGGSGIHAYKSRHIDIVNNIAYLNSASPHIEYGQIFAGGDTADINIVNNILVAPVADPYAGQPLEHITTDGRANFSYATDPANAITYRNNIYFGGNLLPIVMGVGDRIIDPQFVSPSIDPATANFAVRPGSPAISSGAVTFGPASSFRVPSIDYRLVARSTPPDLGAIEYLPDTPVLLRALAGDTGSATVTQVSLAALAVSNATSVVSYSWSLVTGPAAAPAPVFSINENPNAVATVASVFAAGTYTFQVIASNAAGLSAPMIVSFVVPPVLSGLAITPAAHPLAAGNQRALRVSGLDQFGDPIALVSPVAWSVTGSGHAVTPDGVLTTSVVPGPFTVTAASGTFVTSLSGTTVIGVQPVIHSVVSRKRHGRSGNFDLPLSTSGPITSEPRWGGPTNLIFHFAHPVQNIPGQSAQSLVSLSSGTVHSVSLLPDRLEVVLSGVTDASVLNVQVQDLANPSGQPFSRVQIRVRALYGDVNGDAAVTTADSSTVAAAFYRPLSTANFLRDLDASGFITIADQRAVLSRLTPLLG